MENDLELDRLKARMTPEEREKMAKLVENEVDRRQRLKASRVNAARKSTVPNAPFAGELGLDDAKEMYGELNQRIRQLRERRLGEARRKQRLQMAGSPDHLRRKVEELRSKGGQIGVVGRQLLRRAVDNLRVGSRLAFWLVIGSLVVVGTMKAGKEVSGAAVINSLREQGVAYAASNQPGAISAVSDDEVLSTSSEENSQLAKMEDGGNNFTYAEDAREAVLTQLDVRRAKLAARGEELDKREKALVEREKDFQLQLVELKALTVRAENIVKEKDKEYLMRLEQLAGVYGSMQPQDAAKILEKLEDDVALQVLGLLPGKRMGQILSVMSQGRAVELTKKMSGKKSMS